MGSQLIRKEAMRGFELKIFGPVIDEGQGGVDGNSNLWHFFASLWIPNQGGSLVRVVEDDPHEVVQEQGSVELLGGEGGRAGGGGAVAAQLEEPQEKKRS